MSATTQRGSVVPIELSAFCVSKADEQLATGSFSGATVDYQAQTSGATVTAAYLGLNVWRPLTAPPRQRLRAGIHLHWQLPVALTSTSVDEVTGTVEFPPAPSRWLVTRFVIDGASASATSWIVESDALNDVPPAGQFPVTIPLQPGSTSEPNFNFLGQYTPLADYRPAALLDGPRTFKEKTGAELSAVSNGVSTFASFYPESSSVFGFYDPLQNLPESANLMYVVTGWYDATANDPATRSPNLPETHFWATGEPPAYTLYSGSVQDIAWNAQTDYVLQQPNQRPISAHAAVGNTPTEALSAYFAALEDPGNTMLEQILNAFQSGLLPSLTTPDPGTLSALSKSLHDDQFQAIDAGLIYTIVLANPDGTESEATDLTLPIADALNQLNLASQALLEATEALSSHQWAMFANWCRYFQADTALNSAVFNYSSALYANWSGLKSACDAAQQTFDTRMAAMNAMLEGTGLSLQPGPAPRYWQPTDPVVLLASSDLALATAYDAADLNVEGQLRCRMIDEIVSAVTVGGVGIEANSFSAVCALPSSTLPYASDCSNLLMEACLLNTGLAASLSGQNTDSVKIGLEQLLNGEPQSLWTVVSGEAPAPLEVAWWGPQNPWMPILLQWGVEFYPLFSTTSPQGVRPLDYPPDYFTANYTVDPATGSFVRYTPSGGTGITVDPATIQTFPQRWFGQSILSATSAASLADAITNDPAAQSDATLQRILEQLNQTPTLVQALSGFTLALLLQQQIPQLQIAVPPGAPFQSTYITTETRSVVGDFYDLGPYFQWYYNPVRGGWFRISPQSPTEGFLLYAVDVFGQKRGLTLTSIVEAESVTAYDSQQVAVPGVSYAAPRLAQPARLLFEWISASASNLIEMNETPATSPICGWLLPNHLDGGFFLYDGVGRPLGSLELNGDQTRIVWQSAPGDNSTINLPIEEALAAVNPNFKALALALQVSTPKWFLDFWTAVDQVSSSICPDTTATDAGLAVLIGRPVAVAQTSLCLDLSGRPVANPTWSCLTPQEWIVTDDAFTSIQFPVVLGDVENLNDGLIGFFLPASDGGYDLSTFYTEGADAASVWGVVQPKQDTILLTPTPKLDDPQPRSVEEGTLPLLMLLDPRAPVHATTGILPTEELQIPSDMAVAAISTLEMSFLVTPVLKPAGSLALPAPRVAGYDVAFVKEDISEAGNPIWRVEPDISAPTIDAVWSYTPQSLTEGWLRLNPTLLAFEILNGADPNAPLIGGIAQAAILRVTNRKPLSIRLLPGTLVPEGDMNTGSAFYVHFGQSVAQEDVASMTFTAEGWSFQALNDSAYGHYWAATPSVELTVAPGAPFEISISGLKPATNVVQAQVYTDYYQIDGASDGVFADLVTIQQIAISRGKTAKARSLT